MTRERWRRLLAFAWPYRGSITWLSLLLALSAVIAAALPWPTKLAVDHILRNRPLPGWCAWITDVPGLQSRGGQLVVLALVNLGLFALGAALSGVQQVSRQTIAQATRFDLAAEMLESLQRRSAASWPERSTGDTVQRVVDDSRCIAILVAFVGLGALGSLFQLGFLFVVAATIDLPLALIAFAGAAPMLLAAQRFMPAMAQQSIDLANADGRVATIAEQALSSIEEVQAFTAEPTEQRRFDSEVDDRLAAVLRQQHTYLAYGLAVGLFAAVGAAAVLLVGGLRTADGAMSVGDLVVVSSYVAALFVPITGLAQLVQGFNMAKGQAVRVLDVLEAEDALPEPAHPVPFPTVARGSAVAFESVSFGYLAGQLAIVDIDLVIEPGETVAVVGRSGAGKTTLVSLLPRFFDPTSGRVTIDGVDVRDARVHDVRARVSVVRQDSLLLPVSVAENIAYGRPHATIDEVERAAREAHAHEFVEQLPNGYDTVLGEHGSVLSGGQRQRLAIARALLKDAPVLVLDEPTSALDAESEALLVDAVERVARNRTVLVIAHRLSTIRGADRVVVLDEGRIVEQGSFDDLMVAGGPFARMHRQSIGTAVLGRGTGNGP